MKTRKSLNSIGCFANCEKNLRNSRPMVDQPRRDAATLTLRVAVPNFNSTEKPTGSCRKPSVGPLGCQPRWTCHKSSDFDEISTNLGQFKTLTWPLFNTIWCWNLEENQSASCIFLSFHVFNRLLRIVGSAPFIPAHIFGDASLTDPWDSTPATPLAGAKSPTFPGASWAWVRSFFFALNILNQRWAGGLWFLACAAILFHGALHFFEGITAADLRLDPYPGFCQPFLCRPRHCKMAGSRAADGAVGKSYIRSSFANTCSGNRNNNKNKNCVS